MNKTGKKSTKNTRNLVIICIAALLLPAIVLSFFVVIPAGHTKVTAQQNLEKASTEQEQQAMIQQQEAERQKIQADADLYTAQKQAEANQALSESLSDPLVEYYKIQQWDGKLPTVSGGTSLITMDLDEDGNGNSNAPVG